MRYAAIDIGSNAIRLVVVQVQNKKAHKSLIVKKISMTRVPIRLGEDVFEKGVISLNKSQDLMNAMEGFSSLIAAYRVVDFKACATSAMRDALNGPELLSQIKNTCGIDIKIISGKKEAEYILNAGIQKFIDLSKNYLYIDVGGGSTELNLLINGEKSRSASFKLGTVRILTKGWDEGEWLKMKNWLNINTKGLSIEAAIGSGGNINRYYKLAQSKNKTLGLSKLRVLLKSIKSYSYKERMSRFNLMYDRADVIVPAGEIFVKILDEIGVEDIIVPKLGLADGVINEMITCKS